MGCGVESTAIAVTGFLRKSPRAPHPDPTYLMRSAVFSPPDGAARGEWRVLRMLAPYLWEYRWRVAIALVFLVTAKLANVGVPLVMK